MDPEALPAFPLALQAFQLWTKRCFGQDWEDALHEGILHLLELNVIVPMTSAAGLVHIMQCGANNAWRRQWGTGTSRQPHRLQYYAPDVIARMAGTTTVAEPLALVAWELGKRLALVPPLVRTILLQWAQGDGPSQIATQVQRSQPRVSKILYDYAPTWREWHQQERQVMLQA